LPAEKLHEQHARHGVYRSFLEKLMIINEAGSRLWRETEIGSSLRNIVLVAVYGNSSLVVGVVR